jgi:hypothetical protein
MFYRTLKMLERFACVRGGEAKQFHYCLIRTAVAVSRT